jgi:hypothetical protein
MMSRVPVRKPLAFLGASVLAATLSTGPWASTAHAAVSVFQGDLAGFNAAAGNPPITIDFDNPALTDVTGATISGVTFTSPDGNTLDVVNAADTFSPPGYGDATNKLPATSGARILSPGGTDLIQGPDIRQRDGLALSFASPVGAFGVDVLFQSLDGFSFTSYTIYDSAMNPISSGGLNIPGPGGGGVFFIGFTSDAAATDFKRIVFTESDDNDVNPDSNIGYDTLRFVAPTGGIPEPSTWALSILGFGLMGGALRASRRRLGTSVG